MKIQEDSDIPVIYITGNSEHAYRSKAGQTNYRAYLVKPVTKNILSQVLVDFAVK